MEKNAGEWTGSVEIKKEEIPGNKRSMHGYNTDLLQALKGERLSSVFLSAGTLISASAAPHCGIKRYNVADGFCDTHCPEFRTAWGSKFDPDLTRNLRWTLSSSLVATSD